MNSKQNLLFNRCKICIKSKYNTNNHFSSQIPFFFGKFYPTRYIVNFFQWFSCWDLGLARLDKQTKFTGLCLDVVSLSGELPSSLANVSESTTLTLVGNQFTWLMNLTRLTILIIPVGNKLINRVPSQFIQENSCSSLLGQIAFQRHLTRPNLS